MDDSFVWKDLPREELINCMRIQKMEIDLFKHALEERERNSLLKERELRKEIIEGQEKIREKLALRNEESEQLLKEYHEKKVR